MAKEKKATGDSTRKRNSRNTPVAVAQQATQQVSERGNVQVLQASAPTNGGAEYVDDVIRRRAYEIWEQRGREHGRDTDDWYRAESELRGKSA